MSRKVNSDNNRVAKDNFYIYYLLSVYATITMVDFNVRVKHEPKANAGTLKANRTNY